VGGGSQQPGGKHQAATSIVVDVRAGMGTGPFSRSYVRWGGKWGGGGGRVSFGVVVCA
jgi:hypothetical protein